MDSDAAFRVCVQVSQFTTYHDNGSSIIVPCQHHEWVVDSRWYKFKDLEKDIATRVNWSSSQQIIVYEFDADNGREKELCDDRILSVCFSERQVLRSCCCLSM